MNIFHMVSSILGGNAAKENKQAGRVSAFSQSPRFWLELPSSCQDSLTALHRGE